MSKKKYLFKINSYCFCFLFLFLLGWYADYMSRGRNIHPLALVPERKTQTMEIMCDSFFSALFTCFVLSLYFIYHKLLTKNTEFIYNCCKHTFVSDKMIIYRTLPRLLSHQSNIVRHFTQSAILNLQRSAVFNLKEIQHRKYIGLISYKRQFQT